MLEFIINNFKKIRVEILQMSGEEIANALGITRQAISAWETGKAKIPKSMALALIGLSVYDTRFAKIKDIISIYEMMS